MPGRQLGSTYVHDITYMCFANICIVPRHYGIKINLKSYFNFRTPFIRKLQFHTQKSLTFCPQHFISGFDSGKVWMLNIEYLFGLFHFISNWSKQNYYWSKKPLTNKSIFFSFLSSWKEHLINQNKCSIFNVKTSS